MTTFTAGQKLTASQLNLIADVPQATIYQATAQSIPNAVWTAVTFNAEAIDTDNGHSNSTNNTRYTIQRTGKYLLGGSYSAASNATGYRGVRYSFNGGTATGSSVTLPAVNGAITNVPAKSLEWTFVASDYIELQVFQNSTAALNTAVAAPDNSTLTVIFIGS